MDNYHLKIQIHLADNHVTIEEGDYVTIITDRLIKYEMWEVTQINSNSIEILNNEYNIELELEFGEIKEIVRVCIPNAD